MPHAAFVRPMIRGKRGNERTVKKFMMFEEKNKDVNEHISNFDETYLSVVSLARHQSAGSLMVDDKNRRAIKIEYYIASCTIRTMCRYL